MRKRRASPWKLEIRLLVASRDGSYKIFIASKDQQVIIVSDRDMTTKERKICPIKHLYLIPVHIKVALTSRPQKAGLPLTLELSDYNLAKGSLVKISQIGTLSNLRIKDKLGEITPEELEQIIEGLNEIISA